MQWWNIPIKYINTAMLVPEETNLGQGKLQTNVV